jgi:hypothetical protein
MRLAGPDVRRVKKRSIAEDESAAFIFSVSPAPRGLRPPVTRLIIGCPHIRTTSARAPRNRRATVSTSPRADTCLSTARTSKTALGGGVGMWLLVLLALIAALFVGLGFVVKWLFIVAVVLALVWLIAFFAGGLRRA